MSPLKVVNCSTAILSESAQLISRQTQTPQKKGPSIRHGSSLGPIRLSGDASASRKKDSNAIHTPRTSYPLNEGSSRESPIVIEEDEPGGERQSRQPQPSHMLPAEKCAHEPSTECLMSKSDHSGKTENVSTKKRRRTTECGVNFISLSLCKAAAKTKSILRLSDLSDTDRVL